MKLVIYFKQKDFKSVSFKFIKIFALFHTDPSNTNQLPLDNGYININIDNVEAKEEPAFKIRKQIKSIKQETMYKFNFFEILKEKDKFKTSNVHVMNFYNYKNALIVRPYRSCNSSYIYFSNPIFTNNYLVLLEFNVYIIGRRIVQFHIKWQENICNEQLLGSNNKPTTKRIILKPDIIETGLLYIGIFFGYSNLNFNENLNALVLNIRISKLSSEYQHLDNDFKLEITSSITTEKQMILSH